MFKPGAGDPGGQEHGTCWSWKTSGGKTLEFTGRHETTGRGGKGWEAVKRTSLVRVIPPAISLVDWEEFEGKKKEPGSNGAKTLLFEGRIEN